MPDHRAAPDYDDSVARYQRPPCKGRFQPGQSGNPHGRPKGSRNIKTYVDKLLAEPIAVKENGRTRRIPRAEAIAMQIVNHAAAGDPKGLAVILTITRDREDSGASDGLPSVLSRAEDAVVMASLAARIRAAEAVPPTQLEIVSSALTGADGSDPTTTSNLDGDIAVNS